MSMDQILTMFNGDRTNAMYIHFKNDLFIKGEKCDCGAIISEKKCDKNTCNSTNALINHFVFPTFSLLDKLQKKENSQYNHWAYMVEVCKKKTKEYGFYQIVEGFSLLNEYASISFDRLRQDQASKISFSDIKPGYTVVVLYAKQDDKDMKMVMPENANYCLIFKLPILEIQKEAEKLLYNFDLASENKDIECFGCGLKGNDLMQCSSCKIAKYCSRQCQKKSWDMRHQRLCKQSEIILRLACLPRHQNTLPDKYFTFNLNGNNGIALPPYIYKPEFVFKLVII
jgi:hypothetical protein